MQQDYEERIDKQVRFGKIFRGSSLSRIKIISKKIESKSMIFKSIKWPYKTKLKISIDKSVSSDLYNRRTRGTEK